MAGTDDKCFARIVEEAQRGATIIYVATKPAGKKLVETLRDKYKVDAVDMYHADMDATQRWGVQRAFMHNEISVLVATTAFGMGIDKPDIRLIIIWKVAPLENI